MLRDSDLFQIEFEALMVYWRGWKEDGACSPRTGFNFEWVYLYAQEIWRVSGELVASSLDLFRRSGHFRSRFLPLLASGRCPF